MAAPGSSRLLSIPAEIREHIYSLILHPDANRQYHENEYTSYDYRPALVLFCINRLIYIESRKVFRELNIFVNIETPWPEARHHVAREGHVPMIAAGERAAKYEGHYLSVMIDAPEVPLDESKKQAFLVLLSDLDKFTTMWYYSNLSHPGLNAQLRLALKLHDPYTPDYEEKRIAKSLQRKLILPFGVLRNLRSQTLTGDPKPYPSIETELKELQAKPDVSPEHCLREATRLKNEGNAELKVENFHAALKLYDQAFTAIHIVNKGRIRHIHADRFFARELREPPYTDKNGESERLILRVQLVANTCQAYNKLKDFDNSRFWGLRTITTVREYMGMDVNMDLPPEEEAIRRFPATSEMGKIYFRTAVAIKALGDKDEARKLLRVAKIYLPNDPLVTAELASVALRLG
ncbi:hypothetical protein LTR91_002845 [Friedmanniomyces endolithicus]|uniref:Uncharacterized protein n=1 Tax=Friedmanniomyces endolithicus TaxID=329885 RepID=A0AAN6R061_9PEZI|nr:hypothetical protein LTS02_003161 [Friedmanniomyces endolithicus]KAK0878644.1 hypothetical protein LTR87_007505 [Friedmanniomyces endolithicus]KAK0925895.1 hypothetical protein LTR57_004499 [Friedmanniomyces endolithicus]KAK1009195.1 hypothetical protein LTR91_002845 [Friedmanniomyces endolithicus]